MKSPSAFECAIRALRQERSDLPDRILTINMDACAAALCAVDEKGGYRIRNGVQLDASAQSPDSLYREGLSRIPGGENLNEADIARAWRRYIQSGKASDAVDGIPCAALETAFAPAAQLYGELFALADDLLGDEDETGVLLFGSMAGCSLAQHAARSHFSVDPFLPDPLFIRSAHPEALEAQGRQLLEAEARRDFEGPVELMLVNRMGETVCMRLPDHPPAGMDDQGNEVSFFGCAGESIVARAGTRSVCAELPETLFAGNGCGMVFAGWVQTEQSTAVCLHSEARETMWIELDTE